MRIEIRLSTHSREYMAFNPDDNLPKDGIYGFGATYHEALNDYLTKVNNEESKDTEINKNT